METDKVRLEGSRLSGGFHTVGVARPRRKMEGRHNRGNSINIICLWRSYLVYTSMAIRAEIRRELEEPVKKLNFVSRDDSFIN